MRHKVKIIMVLLSTVLLFACASNENKSETKTDQEVAETYLQMGIAYMELGKNNVAMQRLQYALNLDDKNSSIHDALAVLYQKRKEYDQAKTHFKKALQLAPNNPSAKNNYGRFLCDLNEYDKGLVFLQAALATPSNSRKWFALTNIGICEYKRGSRQIAEQYLRKALQLFPAYAPALEQMIAVSYDKQKYISAKGFLERFLAVSKHTSHSLYYAMLIETSLGNPDKAELYKATLMEKYPLSKEFRNLY